MLEPGKYYHIFNRGNNREDIFKEPKNYEYFLKLYEYHINPVAETFAYCLMKNHFHLLVKKKEQQHKDTSQVLKTYEVSEPKSKNASRSFSNLFNAYSKAINKSYLRTGSLFQDRFRRIEVNSDIYFTRLIHYIHFNPQKHRFTDDFRTYPYSSYQIITSEKPTTLYRNVVIKWFGGKNECIEFHNTVAKDKEILNFIGNHICPKQISKKDNLILFFS